MTQEEAEEFAGRILAAIDGQMAKSAPVPYTNTEAVDRERVEADLAAIKRWWFDIHGAKLGPSNYYLNYAEANLMRTAKLYGIEAP